MWKDYDLPSFAVIEGKKIFINTRWKNIIDIFSIFNSNKLLAVEKAECLLRKFYVNFEDIADFDVAFDTLILFVNGNKTKNDGTNTQVELRLIDWEKDLRIIIPPVNRVLGYDVRERPDLHWWTFLGAFNEIGECVFRSYVGIRNKIANRKKLDDYEKEMYKKYKDEINITKVEQYDNFDDEDILMQMAKKEAKYLVDEQ